MGNIVSCIIYNVLGLGTYYFLSLLTSQKRNLEKSGTAVFWGFWTVMLLTYVIWLFIPSRLDLTCYLILILSIIGTLLLLKREGIITLIKSEYFKSISFFIPFVFIFNYIPNNWDEFSHWLLTPKVFYYQHTLAPIDEGFGVLSYTPLWTLQSTFFQFFSFEGFSETIIYVVRINILLSFLFFIKERFNLKFIPMLILSIGILCIFYFVQKQSIQYLLVEFPIYILLSSMLFLISNINKYKKSYINQDIIFLFIAALALYMIKKPLISLFPAVFYILWVKGYKKQIFYLIFLWFLFYFTWKTKTSHIAEPFVPSFQIEGLWNLRALSIYKAVLGKVFSLSITFSIFIGALFVFYKKNRIVFYFYIIFSISYLSGLVFSYLFSFSTFEALRAASFKRYISILFIPAFIHALYILLSEYKKFIKIKKYLLQKWKLPNYILPASLSFLLICFFYNYKSRSEDKSLIAYNKIIKSKYNIKNKKILIIEQGKYGEQLLRFKYYAYEDTKNIKGGSYGPTADNQWRMVVDMAQFIKILQDQDVIVVINNDEWAKEAISQFVAYPIHDIKSFLLLKNNQQYQMIPL